MEQSFKPDRKYFTKVLFMQLTISVALIIIMAIIHLIIKMTNGNPETAYIIWLIGILCLFIMWIKSSLIAHLWIKNLEYIIHEDRVKIHKGILTKTQQNIPFRAITDFALERTLYDRMLGIGSVKIQTAGQSHQPSGYEGKLGGLLEYDKWHSELREKVKSLHPISESVTITETDKIADATVLKQILEELKEIRKNTAYKE
ncbi:MAG: PH domain-containing protein [Calditrichia bacterium]|nr:PH domain-containing protein [Calditrichia bacterium]